MPKILTKKQLEDAAKCQASGTKFFFKSWGEWAPVHEMKCNEDGIKGKRWFDFDPDTSVNKREMR